MTICPTCHQFDPRPAMIARAAGFDASKHCVVVANQRGIVTAAKCREAGWLCENCKIGRAFGFRWPTSKIWKKGKGK